MLAEKNLYKIGDKNSEWKRYCEWPEEGCFKWVKRLQQNYKNQNMYYR